MDLLGKVLAKEAIKILVNNELIMHLPKDHNGLHFYILEGDGIILDVEKVFVH